MTGTGPNTDQGKRRRKRLHPLYTPPPLEITNMTEEEFDEVHIWTDEELRQKALADELEILARQREFAVAGLRKAGDSPERAAYLSSLESVLRTTTAILKQERRDAVRPDEEAEVERKAR